MLGSSSVDVPDILGTVHPFLKTNQSILHSLTVEVSSLVKEKRARRILSFMVLNVLCTALLFVWCASTNSMALTAYTYLTIFDFFSLTTCLVSLWVTKQHASPIFSFGYERFEVLAVFASTILAQFGAVFIVKESVERMLMQPDIHTGRLLVGSVVAFLFHVLVTYSVEKRAFNDVTSASSSSWLQEHVTDVSESLCHVVPGLAKVLLPRINPLALIACAGVLALVLTHALIDMYEYYSADTWAAVWIALMTVGTMFPMSVYSGKILLQTTPSHIIGQLDKCLREASTLDGVLEFRHEHFWTVAFGTMAGSVHVRVRRDADEQMVLAHVYHRLSNLVSVLTVHIFKDDWSRPSAAFQVLPNPDPVALPATVGGAKDRSAPFLGPSDPHSHSHGGQHYAALPYGTQYASVPLSGQQYSTLPPYRAMYGGMAAGATSACELGGHVSAGGIDAGKASPPYTPRFPLAPSYGTMAGQGMGQGGVSLPGLIQSRAGGGQGAGGAFAGAPTLGTYSGDAQQGAKNK